MARERLYLFDTTLRDGAQTQGVDFSVEDKRTIAAALDELGIDYIEGGWPGANPTDSEFFTKAPRLEHAAFTAFGMTRRSGRSVENDPGLKALLDADVSAICIVGKTWDFHVDVALGIEHGENLKLIESTIKAIADDGREALFDAEHFFDGYKANPDFAMACIEAALSAGARWAVLCDTNGGTLPGEVGDIVSRVADRVGGENLGIHAHNDTENAVANSLAAVEAGARHVQGTLNGLGERCGNANMVSLIPTLVLKDRYADRFETGVTAENLLHLTSTAHMLDELLNRAPNRHQPYVGASAFAHKGGLHVSAVQKDPRTYEHIDPERVGNRRQILVSNQAGRSNIIARLHEAGIDIDDKHPKIDRLLESVKQKEYEGYSYDGAEASFELMARDALGEVPDYFDVESFRVLVERRYNALGELISVAEATVKVEVDGETLISVGEGNGPVSALDQALRKDLGRYSKYIDDVELVDFKVRILNSQGTASVTRVLIEWTDSSHKRWFTVGLSPNIVDASFQALYDGVVYKLFKEDAPAAGK